MHEALEPTRDPGWLLSHQGYNVLTESAVESSLAFGNGFLGMRAARSVSRGPTWVAWLGYSRWASWPRCYVAGLFDMPNTEPPVPALVPVADWSRVRILLDGEPLLAREGEVILGTRQLDMHRGLLLSAWTHRTPAGITATGRELRLLSLADRAAGLQFLQFALDRDGIDVRLEASFAMAGLGMEPVRLEQDLGAWRTEGTRKGVAMTGAATLRLGGEPLVADRPFSLRWAWRWRSVAGQVAEFDRLVAVARAGYSSPPRSITTFTSMLRTTSGACVPPAARNLSQRGSMAIGRSRSGRSSIVGIQSGMSSRRLRSRKSGCASVQWTGARLHHFQSGGGQWCKTILRPTVACCHAAAWFVTENGMAASRVNLASVSRLTPSRLGCP